jgi:hypothetical protein
VDVESVDSIHALKLLEAIEGYLACSCDELQELGTLFFVERSHGPPEPLDLSRSGVVILVLRVPLPIVDVDFGKARDEKLQFLLVEDRDQFGRNDIMETCKIAWLAKPFSKHVH